MKDKFAKKQHSNKKFGTSSEWPDANAVSPAKNTNKYDETQQPICDKFTRENMMDSYG